MNAYEIFCYSVNRRRDSKTRIDEDTSLETNESGHAVKNNDEQQLTMIR